MRTGRTALEGIRVLDVTQVMAGPFCAMQLCDMGADVIKVEPPEGDPTRQMGARRGSDSAGFAALNRGKRGIVLDLEVRRRAAGLRAARGPRRHPHRELPARRDATSSDWITRRSPASTRGSSTRRSQATARRDRTRRRADSIWSRRASPA